MTLTKEDIQEYEQVLRIAEAQGVTAAAMAARFEAKNEAMLRGDYDAIIVAVYAQNMRAIAILRALRPDQFSDNLAN